MISGGCIWVGSETRCDYFPGWKRVVIGYGYRKRWRDSANAIGRWRSRLFLERVQVFELADNFPYSSTYTSSRLQGGWSDSWLQGIRLYKRKTESQKGRLVLQMSPKVVPDSMLKRMAIIYQLMNWVGGRHRM